MPSEELDEFLDKMNVTEAGARKRFHRIEDQFSTFKTDAGRAVFICTLLELCAERVKLSDQMRNDTLDSLDALKKRLSNKGLDDETIEIIHGTMIAISANG